MYRFERGAGSAARLTSDRPLTPADFEAIAKELGVAPSLAQKIGFVAARKAEARQQITTFSGGDKETTNVAEAGDWVVTNMTPDGEYLRDSRGRLDVYVIKAATFARIYESMGISKDNSEVYRPNSIVEMVELPGGYEIVAPWNELQRAASGHLVRNGDDVYGIEAAAFKATYDVLAPAALRLLSPGPKRMLALDGGGVRGMLTLAFLERLERVLREQHGNAKLVLSDYFDMIGGTSVGSILATQLALGDEVAAVKGLFKEWCPEIFHTPPLWRVPKRLFPVFGKLLAPMFDERNLEGKLKERLGDMTLRAPELRTGLCIVTKRVDTGSPWVLTNNPRSRYWNGFSTRIVANKSYRLADVVRASAAAPSYFKPHEIQIMSDSTAERGLFVDGAVSPFNNPALQMLMLAGIRGYGLHWPLGQDNLLMISVGTGSYRSKVGRGDFMVKQAIDALRGVIGDGETLSLTLLQWMGASGNFWRINSEVGDLADDCLGHPGDGVRPLLRFQRYDAPLETQWLKDQIGFEAPDNQLASLRDLCNPHTMPVHAEIGRRAAEQQVRVEHFPEGFKVGAG